MIWLNDKKREKQNVKYEFCEAIRNNCKRELFFSYKIENINVIGHGS